MTTHLSLTIDEGGETELSLPTSSSDERSRRSRTKPSGRTRRQQQQGRRPPAVVVAADATDVCSTTTATSVAAATQKTVGVQNGDHQPTTTTSGNRPHRLYLHRFGTFVSNLSISAASGMGLVQLPRVFELISDQKGILTITKNQILY